jgi:hypothetical protein
MAVERAKLDEVQAQVAQLRETVRLLVGVLAAPRPAGAGTETDLQQQQQARLAEIQKHSAAVQSALRRFNDAQRHAQPLLTPGGGGDAAQAATVVVPPGAEAVLRDGAGVAPDRWGARAHAIADAGTALAWRTASTRGGDAGGHCSLSLSPAAIRKQLDEASAKARSVGVSVVVDPQAVRVVSVVAAGVIAISFEVEPGGAIGAANARGHDERGGPADAFAPSRYVVMRAVAEQAGFAAMFFCSRHPTDAIARFVAWAAAYRRLFQEPCAACQKLLGTGTGTSPIDLCPPAIRDVVNLKPYHVNCYPQP